MNQPSELLKWIEQLDQASILVIGDIMMDRFISGDVLRISPEGPVPILRLCESRDTLGGAGNVARNLAALGVNTFLISAVGRDEDGECIEKLLAAQKTIKSVLIREGARRTTVKTRFLSQQQQLLRVDTETVSMIEKKSELEVMSAIREYLPRCGAMIISDYGKGFLSPGLLKEAIEFCREHGKTVLVDPKGLDYSVYRGADIVTPNLRELAEATRLAIKGDGAVIEAARLLISALGFHSVLVTRSNEGMSLIESSGKTAHFRSQAKEVFDVTGAGDTVIALLGAALSSGAPLGNAVEIANLAAGIVVGKIGTAVTYVSDLIQAVRNQELSAAELKVVDLRSAVDRVEIWKRKGYRIGFINGFFELLHPAHIKLLSMASKACDRLIVGVNSDASIYRLKGRMPELLETARSAIIASLEDVDAVIVFQGDSPGQLLEVLHPDVYIKASAGTSDKLGLDSVCQYKEGRTMLVNLQEETVKGGSTAEHLSVVTG
jgi:D-beta-D-heptose 7-phosphate kinase / D-beta-D-heptose 1-phosphate adenosyltransferase